LCSTLLAARADPLITDSSGTSAMQLATSFERVVEAFTITTGIDVQLQARLSSPDTLLKPNRKTNSPVKGETPSSIHAFRQYAMLHDAAGLSQIVNDHSKFAAIFEADSDGNSSLHLCLMSPPQDHNLKQLTEALDVLLNASADPCAVNKLGETPLLVAVCTLPALSPDPPSDIGLQANPRVEVVNMLLRARANPDTADTKGMTPLMEACSKEDAHIVQALLDGGADTLCTNSAGKSAISLTPAHGQVRKLFSQRDRHIASRERLSKTAGTTRGQGILNAVQAHDAHQIKNILSSYQAEGKNPLPLLQVQDADGHGWLHLSILAPPVYSDKSGVVEATKVLLEAQANPNMTNALGETALLLTVRELGGSREDDRLKLVRMLLRAGAEQNAGDIQDTTPLMEAAALGDAEICKILLNRGADMHRRGAHGLSARDVAESNGLVKQVFQEQQDNSCKEQDLGPPLEVTLEHAETKFQKIIMVPSKSTIRDIKKQIVRQAHRGSWRRVALLTEHRRALHDSEYLNGRTVLVMADAHSYEAQKAAEEALPEEERWKRWSEEEVKAEANRRGIFGGYSHEQILASLLEVKRWEGLSAKELRMEFSKRGLMLDTCSDKQDFIAQLKADFSLDQMQEGDLRQACYEKRVAFPEDEKDVVQQIRSRLRMVYRWERLPVDALLQACSLRNFDATGKSSDEMLDFLKLFKTLPKPKDKPKPKEMPRPKEAASCTKPSSASSRSPSVRTKRKKESLEMHSPSPEDDLQLPSWMQDRVRRICQKYPAYCGNYPEEMNDWNDEDIEIFIYSNGFIKPGSSKKKPAIKIPKKHHYEALGLPDGAPASDIKKAYRQLALKYHPDKNLNDASGVAEDRFKTVTAAYEALMCEDKAQT